MTEFDLIVVGAGPASTGVVAGLMDRGVDLSRTLILDGNVYTDAAVALSSFGAGGSSRIRSVQTFGLPAVRAFGQGGTTALWHGGLFLPDGQDRIVGWDGNSFDLEEALIGMCGSRHLRSYSGTAGIIKASEWREDPGRCGEPHWRNVMIPRRPAFIAPSCIFKNSSIEVMDHIAVDINKISSESLIVRTIGKRGCLDLRTRKVVLAAGCLGSLPLLASYMNMNELKFNDHLHAFVGSLSLDNITSFLAKRLGNLNAGSRGYVRRNIWKCTVNIGDYIADVSFSFRAVANPNYPRLGRNISQFIGIRRENIKTKIRLAISNPITAIELLGYKYGIQLPFNNILVHATISPSESAGRVGVRGDLDFCPDKEAAAAAAINAFKEFCEQEDLKYSSFVQFSHNDVRDSIISGAQFSNSSSNFERIKESIDSIVRDNCLHLADTSALNFTSVYNQGLMSIAHGYKIGSELNFR